MSMPKVAALLTCLAALLAGCSSTPKSTVADSTSTAPSAPAAPAPASPTTAATPSSAVTPVSIPEYLDPNSALSTNRSIYFDFDDFSIKSEFNPVIERHGQFLSAHPAVAVKVEGHADERGSAEYNLALGQKRAEAVAKALKIYGVKDAQVESISWGKEKPKASGHDESAWSQNRRADITYPTK
ncbi:MAG: peptidoglycan-associated lipoprotein Pal [Acidobacteriota bacterium]